MSCIDKAKELVGSLITKYMEGFKQNPLTVLTTTGVAVTTVAGLFYKAYSYVKTKAATQIEQANIQTEKVETTLSSVIQENTNVLKENTKLKEELQVYKAGNSAVAEFKDLMVQKDAKIENLEAQVKQLITERNTIQREYDDKFKEKTEDPYIKKILQT